MPIKITSKIQKQQYFHYRPSGLVECAVCNKIVSSNKDLTFYDYELNNELNPVDEYTCLVYNNLLYIVCSTRCRQNMALTPVLYIKD